MMNAHTHLVGTRSASCYDPFGTQQGVCVYVHHENAKLLAIACNSTYSDLMQMIVCDVTSKMCMVHRCENCPGSHALKQYLQTVFSHEDSDYDDEAQVTYQQ